MPEGDTIFRAAAMMERALAGRLVRAFESPLPVLTRFAEQHGLAGRRVDRVEARGKYLLVHFSGGLALLTHMRMSGSWHLYRPGERWKRPRGHMRARIVTDDYEAVGFDIPVAEFHDAGSLARSERLRSLGPDPLSESFDPADAVSRLKAAGDLPIEEALLDQRRIAGIGNVLKSEALFIAGLDPYQRAGTIPDDALARVVQACRQLLRDNVIGVIVWARGAVGSSGVADLRGASDRTTRGAPALAPIAARSAARVTTRSANPAAHLYVYGRAGKPCRRCATPILLRRAGRNARSTYWCPQCQNSGAPDQTMR